MKLEIYGETKPQETVVRLRLLPGEFDGDAVRVVAVSRNGSRVNRGTLITFKCNGETNLNSGINPELGFNLNSRGRLIIKKEDSGW